MVCFGDSATKVGALSPKATTEASRLQSDGANLTSGGWEMACELACGFRRHAPDVDAGTSPRHVVSPAGIGSKHLRAAVALHHELVPDGSLVLALAMSLIRGIS